VNESHVAAMLSRLANEPTYSAYIATTNALTTDTRSANALAADAFPPLRLAVLRNYTVEPLLPVIQGEIGLAGFRPELYVGDHDAILPDVLDPHSALYAFQPDLIMVALWLETLSPALTTRFVSLTREQVAAEIEWVLHTIDEIVANLRRQTGAPILLNNFPLPLFPTLGILDAQAEQYAAHTILQINRTLAQRQQSWRDLYLVDLMGLMARIGSAHGIDERRWQIGRAPLSRHALVPLGQEYGTFLRALQGKSRKCLVLDCDNTLWGGIVGEDGMDGIQLDAAYPGSCYQALQREIRNLHDRGVILALCSKNNERDVLDVLRHHPDMLLHAEHFATWQINWNDKVTNLKRIAHNLNIGLDSLVFVDDNEFECEWVRTQLPEVAVVQLTGDPSTYRRQLIQPGHFDTLTFSPEDRQRTGMYRAEAKRRQLHRRAGSLDAYLTRLEMRAEIGVDDAQAIPRVAQLTQKTNQFNLTTRRYSEGDIHAFVQQPQSQVFHLRLRDRIADLGLIGVAVVRYHGDEALIDTFLLSCRALGRGAEDALLAHVLNSARDRGCHAARGLYRATAKNGQVANFYARHGFQLATENADGQEWVRMLESHRVSPPQWIAVEISDPEMAYAD